jgi:5-methylthioadenosine/S-adenosylhomocysteine deaminase
MSPAASSKEKAKAGLIGDGATAGTFALSGSVATMNATFDVIDPGTVYVKDGAIVAVQPAAAPAPAGFAGVAPLAAGGAIYPGLIELHNHLAYNVLPLWQVPKLYHDRDQWRGTVDYEKLISRPMGLLGKMPAAVLAICRYVECKCLLGGVTTSQGIRLVSDAGISKYFRGAIRTVEQPAADPRLPAAQALISDPDATDPKKFWAALQTQDKKGGGYLLHLSEGTDASARKHFLSLQIAPGTWAIDRALAGIHCAALQPADFTVMAAHQGAMIWSPFSNLLLYGKTADVAAARAAGVAIGLGPDWSPSGSKSLFGELKVAKLWSDNNGSVFSARDLVAMATRDAAAILRWDGALGSIEAGKRADLLVAAVAGADPYAGLLAAAETAIRLVTVDGVARYGTAALMAAFRADAEPLQVGGQPRALNLKQAPGDADVAAVSFAQAAATLTAALANLPNLATGTAAPVPGAAPAQGAAPAALHAAHKPPAAGAGTTAWALALDEIQNTQFDLRPHLPVPGTAATGAHRAAPTALAHTAIALAPIRLDPPTVADDPAFLATVAKEINLPPWLQTGLATLYPKT